ncbi:MAG: FISUMP domain-containing protein [Patescibacteria group bacterium]|nr:FISUMP domain-containing protein [Patescibacteria group bacterium]
MKMKIFLKKTILLIPVILIIVITNTTNAAFTEPTVAPSSSDQDFTQNILGANNNNNDFDSTNVTANTNGSLIERLEYIIDSLASLWTNSGDDLYYTTGNVGVATTTPAQKLSVDGKIYSTEGFQLPDGNLIDSIGDLGKWIGSSSIYYNTGNVGIGTTTPSALLEVSGEGQQGFKVTDTTNSITTGIWSGTSQGLIGTYTNTDLRLITNGTSKMTILSGGNVGIGTTSPGEKLEVNGNIIADTPTADNHLATKAYVDAAASTSKTELWPDGTTCTAGIEDQLGWDEGASAITYCDGSNWIVEKTGCGKTVRHGGQDYETVQIGTQCWFAENLNIGTKLASGATEPTDNGTIEKWCYDNSDANCTTYGGFYNWDEAMQYTETAGAQGICPAGWHIPTDSEQDTLDQYLSTGTCDTSRSGAWDCSPAGTALKVGGSSGFEGKLSGYRNTGTSFGSLGTHTHFWSSTVSGSNAWIRTLYSSHSTVSRYPYSQANGFSVRCLKD